MLHQFSDQLIINAEIIAIRYFVLCGIFFLVFYFLFKKPLNKYKLQSHYPSPADNTRDILYSISSILIIGVIFTTTVTVLAPYTQLYFNIEEYSNWYFWLTFPLMVIVHDTYFYWTHRLIHSKLLFNTVHLVHHKSTNPSPWTSYAFHPTEAAVQAMVVPVIAFLFPVHLTALIVYFILQFLHNIYGHLGFELLPASVRSSTFGKLLNTSVVHNGHHKNVRGNYGLYFTFWDRLMGTFRG